VSRHVAWLVVDYFASRKLVIDYFAYAARPGASARRVARPAARRRLLRLRRASECLGMSRSSSRGLSSTTSPTLRVRVPRHVARLVAWLLVDYFASRSLSWTTSTTPRV
jgi:predicted DNA-binding transcriptional regulator AlpA